MTVESAIGCACFMAAGALTPGPNNAVLLAAGMAYGWRRTAPLVLAIAAGSVLLVGAVGLGVGAILAASPTVTTILRLAGAAYLLYFAWGIARTPRPQPGTASPTPIGPVRMLVFQFINPKGWIIAATLVTAFARPDAPLDDLVPLALITGVVAALCASVWAVGGAAMSRLASRPRAFRGVHIASAAVIAVTAVFIVVEPLLAG